MCVICAIIVSCFQNLSYFTFLYARTELYKKCQPPLSWFFAAVKTGESCDKRMETCLSPFAKCMTGICKCDSFFTPTNDGRCRIAKTRYIGETCRGNGDCEYPGTCVNSKCACVDPQREITTEEFWIDPSLTIQCRPRHYNTCKYT